MYDCYCIIKNLTIMDWKDLCSLVVYHDWAHLVNMGIAAGLGKHKSPLPMTPSLDHSPQLGISCRKCTSPKEPLSGVEKKCSL